MDSQDGRGASCWLKECFRDRRRFAGDPRQDQAWPNPNYCATTAQEVGQAYLVALSTKMAAKRAGCSISGKCPQSWNCRISACGAHSCKDLGSVCL